MNARSTLALVAACLLPLVAAAQYQWIDKDGRKVFSDRPPPSDVPANKILKQPKGGPVAAEAPAAAAAAAGGASAPAAAGSAPKLAGKDKALEDKKKQQESAEAAKKKAEEEKLAQMKAENCTRAKESKAAFDSGTRITKFNEKGERYTLDDQQRAAEAERINKLIASDCKQDRQ
ncbi:DUF4124 domain-containing protein [Ramlibacter albus]|uniref:DUF4124 domain-containing protein n=1 Tax=Ramlibacter albus TaxID=2079448 RepID=A0A923M6Q6_9BURK|nr:DUF4124 domain-containing protein [Ramlibacter albus]MBC5764365.1 DUF4124 domain-containing protein [Ramlibacter albus]